MAISYLLNTRFFYYLFFFLLLSCSSWQIEKGFLNFRALLGPPPHCRMVECAVYCCSTAPGPTRQRRTLWNWWLLTAHLLLLFLLTGDRACGAQPVGMSGESRNASSWESTKPPIQEPGTSVASTKVGLWCAWGSFPCACHTHTRI